MDTTPLYDALSSDYDRFVNWPSRLALELPFLQTELKRIGAARVLDSACGTGQHALHAADAPFGMDDDLVHGSSFSLKVMSGP